VPPAADLPIILGIAVLGSLAMPLFSTAYKYGEASFVAPFEYSAMFWAVLYGVLIFGDVPGLATWIGSTIVVVAGLFMLAMDRRARMRPAA
jgi:drug/metabolite transporter (DMT)-like permease